MKNSFTLIETIVALAIFSLLIYFASAANIYFQQSNLLNDYIEEVSVIILRSQNRALSGQIDENNNYYSFGIAFSPNGFLEFKTISDFPNRKKEDDWQTFLPSNLIFSTISLPNSCQSQNDCLIFSPLEGTISAQGILKLENLKTKKAKNIYINKMGKLEL